MKIEVFNRKTQKIFEEQVFGKDFMTWAYENPIGRAITSSCIIQKSFSTLLGCYYKSMASKHQVATFIEKYSTQISDFVVPTNGFASFNDFFIREYKKGLRTFPESRAALGACAEGRLSVVPLDSEQCQLHIKGNQLSVAQFLNSKELAKEFLGGWIWTFRLCPVDYHRFHFPDSGTASAHQEISGKLDSVHPIALIKEPEIFVKNLRHLVEFESENFKKILFLDVGAIGVGSIKQTYTPNTKCARGDERGYFEFGGSTVVMITKKDGPVPAQDIRALSAKNMESYVHLGEKITE